MKYIKVYGTDGTIVAAEAIEAPAYVRLQEKNGFMVRCAELKAQGILSADGGTIYQLEGKDPLEGKTLTAVFIDVTEYTVLSETLGSDDTTEDDTTEDGATEDQTNEGTTSVMSRAEMATRIIALEEQLAAAKILLGVE